MITKTLQIAPIVEGDGDVVSVPILLRRIAHEFAPGSATRVLTPIRQPRMKLVTNRDDCLSNSIELAVRKLRQKASTEVGELIVVLLDADEDCGAECGPATLNLAKSLRCDVDICCVFAVLEYETWFVAAAESLQKYLDIDDPEMLPQDPERQGCRKKWIQDRFRGTKYSETVDQPKLTSAMDLQLCRQRSPSFDKLCRDVGVRLHG